MLRKLLLTGFDPFDGEVINPSREAIREMPLTVNNYALIKLCLPVAFGEAAKNVITVAEDTCPEVILCVGQAGGRAAITPEMVGINLRHAKNPDCRGNRPQDEPIIEGGADAYFSTLPVRKIADAIRAAGLPSQVSYSAGAYVCNDVLYTLLAHYANTNVRVGFIHVPYCTEQRKEPCMDVESIVKGLCVAIENLDT